MKVLLANKFFFLNGGSERVFFQERDFLLQHGVKVIDFSMEDSRNFQSPYSEYFVSNVDYQGNNSLGDKVKHGIKFLHSSEAIKKLKTLVSKEKPDIAHLHNIYHQLTPSIIPFLKQNGVKVLLTLHDGKLICPSYLMLNKGEICTICAGRKFWKPFTTKCHGSLAQELLFMVEAYWHKWKKSYEEVDLYIAPSRFLAKVVSLRIPSEKIRILHNGVKIDEFKSNYSDEGYILYFGRISKEKGVETLLKAHEGMVDSLPLKIVGTGPQEEGLRSSYPAADFIGYKSGKELNDLLVNAGFVVVPSECYENCSMVVLEAMAMGKPVIGSKIGGIPEQIEDGKTGFLFEMGDMLELKNKMSLLISDRKLRENMGRAARQKLEREYSLAEHCKGLMTIYEELL